MVAPGALLPSPTFRTFRDALKHHERDIVRSWCWEWVVNGDVHGTEVTFIDRLLKTAPREYRDREEIESAVRSLTCDAVNEFDHKRGMAFNAYLHQTLEMQCGNFQQYLWVRSSGNRKCRKLPLPDLETRTDEADDSCATRTKELHSYSSAPTAERSAEFAEFSQSLDSEDAKTLDDFLALASDPDSAMHAKSRNCLAHFEKRGIKKERLLRLMQNGCKTAVRTLSFIDQPRRNVPAKIHR